MKYLEIFISIIAILAFSTSCKKESESCPIEFVVFGEVLPYAETYKVGDTLTLKTNYNYMIYEKNTKQYFDMKGLNIEAILYIIRTDTIFDSISGKVTEYVEVLDNNNYNYSIQNFSDGSSELFSDILFDGKTFKHELKIILKKKGIFMLTYGPSTIENNFNFEGKCDKYSFFLYTRLNENSNNNIELLSLSPDEHFNTWILQMPNERFYRGRFAYRVIE